MHRIAGGILVLIVVLLYSTSGIAAQSSKDNPLKPDEIRSAGLKYLGKAVKYNDQKEYTIGHGDVLGVQIYGEGDMSVGTPVANRQGNATDTLRSAGGGGAQVRIDGRVSLNHIGDIQAVGYTLTQFADYLKELYSSVFDDPIVTVALIQSNSQRYTVMGKVIRPGIYYIDYPINLVQVVARCGGFTEWAKSEIRLVRKEPREQRKLFEGNTLSFDYDDFLDGQKLEKNVLVKEGDIIIVQ